MSRIEDFSQIRLDGGDLSLDFVNTIHDRYEEPHGDYLTNYPDLVNWAHYAGGINDTQKDELLEEYRIKPEKAEQIFKKAIQLREAIYTTTVHLINREKVSRVEVQIINDWLSQAFSNLALTQVGDDFTLDWKEGNFGLESVLWPIVRSFVELVTSEMRERIKQCSNCGWVFVDGSKNNSRRWCSMETCGNRVKARRYAKRYRP